MSALTIVSLAPAERNAELGGDVDENDKGGADRLDARVTQVSMGGEIMSRSSAPRQGGLGLFGLASGLGAGLIAAALVTYGVDGAVDERAGKVAVAFTAAASIALLFIAERGAFWRGALAAMLIGAAIAAPTYAMLGALDETRNLAPFPAVFWLAAGAPISVFLLIGLARSALAPPRDRYSEFFLHASTAPIAVVGGALLTILGLVLLFAFAGLLRSWNFDHFHRLFQQPWFLLPFIGALAGGALGLMRGAETLLGAVRFAVLFLARVGMPVAALFALVLAVIFGWRAGTAGVAAFDSVIPLFAVAIVSLVCVNGVYQNGHGAAPPGWLRASAMIAIVAAPFLIGLSVWAQWSRIADLGLTPARVIGVAVTSLAGLYTLFCLFGAVSDLGNRKPIWMPLLAPLNLLMATIWAAAFILFASPLIDAWRISARSQESRIVQGAEAPDAYDFGYLKFRLGASGMSALERLTRWTDGAHASDVQAEARRALAAPTYFHYRENLVTPPPAPMETPAIDAHAPSAIDSLEFNPADAPPLDEPDAPTSSPP